MRDTSLIGGQTLGLESCGFIDACPEWNAKTSVMREDLTVECQKLHNIFAMRYIRKYSDMEAIGRFLDTNSRQGSLY